MADEHDRPASERPAAPPFEEQPVDRQEWIAQADGLARLRDEVRGSAEREAMEIVTAARRDIRRIVGDARRELFVLSAQVHAALGDAPPGRLALPAPLDERDASDDLVAFASEEWEFAPRGTARRVVEEARADISSLVDDARAVHERLPDIEEFDEPAPYVTEDEDDEPAPAVHRAVRAVETTPDFVLLSGASAPRRRSKELLWPLVSAVGLIALSLYLFWPSSTPETEPVAADVATAQPSLAPQPVAPALSPVPPPVSAPAPATPAASAAGAQSGVRVVVEARRPAWIRATVDGRPDIGRTFAEGTTFELRGTSVALRVGDAGAVAVSVNGAPAQILGRDGQVVNRLYGEAPPAPVVTPSTIPSEQSAPVAAAPGPGTPN